MKKITLLTIFILTLIIVALLDLAPIQVPDGIDKIYHFIGFAILTFLATLNFIEFFGTKSINLFLFFMLTFGGVFAGISEVLQKFIAIRSCDVNDWLVNLCGIALVCAVTFLANSKERKSIELSQERFDFKDLPILS